MNANTKRAQTALEYLITYGWVVLIISIALASLYALGIFNTNTYANDVCAITADFVCQGTVLASNGLLSVSITQQTSDPINITAIACDTNQSLINAKHITPPVYLAPGQNHTFAVTCFSYGAPYSAPVGTLYSGYILVSYTDLATLFNHTIAGTVALRVKP